METSETLVRVQNQCRKTLEHSTGLSCPIEKCTGSVSELGFSIGEIDGGTDFSDGRNVVLNNVEIVYQLNENGGEGLEESRVEGGPSDSNVDVFGPSDQKGDREVRLDEEKKEVVVNPETKFCIGDLVWAKSETQSWWPGLIQDPSKNKAKSDQKDGFLVKFFGNNSSFWCSQSELKPFLEFFDQISKKNKSKSFVFALEKALGEIGTRVKTEMSCSCFLKTSRKCEKSDEFSANRFEPRNFLEIIKHLAKQGSKPGMIELIVTQNRLSAYFCSLGHPQLPINQLRPNENFDKNLKKSEERVDDGDEDLVKVTKENYEKGHESRERKKSKYLSPPYVNPGWNGKSSPVSEDDEQKNIDVSQSSKKRVLGTRSEVKKNASASSSSQMLLELRLSALDCFHPVRSKCFGLVDEFFCGFRKFAFLDNISPELEGRQKEEEAVDNSRNEPITPKRRAKKEIDQLTTNGESLSKKGKKKTIPPRTDNVEGVLDLDGNKSGSVPDGESLSKKRKKKTIPPRADNVEGVPDLDGNKSGSVPDGESLSKKRKKKTIPPHTDNVEGVLDLNGNKSGSVPDGESLSKKRKKTTIPPRTDNVEGVPNLDGNKSGSVPECSKTGSFSNVGQPLKDVEAASLGPTPEVNGAHEDPSSKPKKRKRKKKMVEDNDSALPDLNGNPSEPIPAGKVMPENNSISPETKPPQQQKKKRKRTNKLPPVGEANGISLLLKFDAKALLPSKESLVTTFSLFGPLKESETRVSADGSAQIEFLRSSDAGEARRSLEKNNPFGASLISFRLHSFPVAPRVDVLKTPAETPAVNRQGEAPDLVFIRKNLEMMTSTLEKAGDNLSPEMRTKLESEIKCLLNKVSTMAGKSSSSPSC